ncbi:putative serine protease 42 isoform X2 [Pollicipes pollicipes]|uniref:putative serine protease 42 isoform X1 n=1 Tax=Pollicipes pollicipes TaxID=41117 RepID=UPI0018850297|nr:putative serine protease 42 isoform X1 [Pollicipes pollicipes]XP_037082725.1 putative serine protease 42 isoform X2 [Pollicipes pollicipes]
MRVRQCLLATLLTIFGDLALGRDQSTSSELVTSSSSSHRRSRREANSCFYNGELYRCTFSITCIFTGGKIMPNCGNLLYSCCLPESTKRFSGHRHDRGFRFPSFPLSLTSGRPAPRRVIFRRQPHVFGTRHFGGRRPRPPRQHLAAPSLPALPDLRHLALTNFLPQQGHNEISGSSHREPECGVPLPRLQKRIIGGYEADYGELPWQAHIRILGYQCGGVLVSRRHVVTAAHCVHRANLKDIKVHLGEYDTKDTGFYPEPYPSAVRSVAEVRINPRFHYMLTQPDRFDVAVLRLDYPVDYRANILPICLPADHADYTGHMAVVAGWGKTDNSFSKTGTNILNKAPVPIIANENCLQWHHQKHIDLQLHAEMFCAGHESGQRDACLGDSGGPLIVRDGGHWTLAGITSAGFGCAVDHQPGIYHKVSSSANWIRDNIRD